VRYQRADVMQRSCQVGRACVLWEVSKKVYKKYLVDGILAINVSHNGDSGLHFGDYKYQYIQMNIDIQIPRSHFLNEFQMNTIEYENM
jgi:hypothetical protein